ncbi:SET domain-containing protein 5 [Candidozyma auris]|nr:5-formyltetrahydrofolate cyclo-ligase [[Candida] auris]
MTEIDVPPERTVMDSIIHLWKTDPTTESLSAKKLHQHVLTNHPEWTLSEKRLKSIMKKFNLLPATSNELFTYVNEITSSITPELSLPPMVNLMMTSKRGKGLFARTNIEKGTLLWEECPLFLVPPLAHADLIRKGNACTFCGRLVRRQRTGPSVLFGEQCKICPETWCSKRCKSLNQRLHGLLKHESSRNSTLSKRFSPSAFSKLLDYSIKEQWNALYAITLIVAEILLDESGLKGRQFKALARVSQRTRAKAEVNNHAIGFSQSSSFFSEQQERVWEEGYSYFIKVFPLSNSDVDFSLDNFLLMLGSYNINNLDCSIYATQSHLNHNCEPNTEVDSGETRGSFGIKVLSSRFISAGEELTTTATSVGLFMNMPCEVNTEELIHHCFKAKKKVYLPRCEIANGGSRMRFLQVNTFEEVQMLKPSGKLALREPKQGVDIMDDGPLDVLVVPGLGFTLDGRRLGRGAAYYDKFLASYFERFRQKPYLIGICFVEQLVDNIPTERHDWNLDEIVSGNNH